MSSQSHWLPENTDTCARGVPGLRHQPLGLALATSGTEVLAPHGPWALGLQSAQRVRIGQGDAPTELPLSQGAWLLPVPMTLNTLFRRGLDAQAVSRPGGKGMVAPLLCPVRLMLSCLPSEPYVLASPDTGLQRS